MSNNNKNRASVLVVDDKQENLLAMQQALSVLNANIVLANSGNEALARALEQRFAVILLDAQMPQMDGFETATLLHANQQTAAVPIIFVTAKYKDPDYIRRAYDIGVVDYLHKPVDKQILLSKVNTFLQLEQQQAALQKTSNTFEQLSEQQALLLNNTDDGIMSIDSDGRITFANPKACKLFSLNEQALLNESITHLLKDENINHYLSNIQKTDIAYFTTSGSHRREITLPTDEQTPFELNIVPVLNADTQINGYILSFHDITERKHKEEKLLWQAHHDSLTGLANRMLLKEFLKASLVRNKRKQQHTGLLFLDLDKFKEVNDLLGHETGDMLLNHVADRLKQCVRKSDLIARLGGDEFVIVLDEITQVESVTVIAEKITATLTKPFYIEGRAIDIGISIGIALWPDHASSAESMLKAADQAMYKAKQTGGNCFCFYR
ncbi:MAG: diguanylate cyclase [Endozoicomonadaceae bacterium]|nr:diguanylate cyclase [Endozoicomonadaceae bacterium]